MKVSPTAPPPRIWGALLCLAFLIRWGYILRGHPALHFDEATTFEYVRCFFDRSSLDERALHRIGEFRTWLAVGVSVLSGGWEKSVPFTAVMLGLAGHALWVFFLYRRVSPWVAWGAAWVLALAPLSIAYYGTLLESRLEIIFFGGLLAIGAGKWFASTGRSYGFGLLGVWCLWTDPLMIFFTTPLFLYESFQAFKTTKRLPWIGWAGTTGGVLMGAGVGFIQWSDPVYRTVMTGGSFSYYRWGLESFWRAFQHLEYLFAYYPQFLQGNLPYGYLQNSAIGAAVRPALTGAASIAVASWSWCTAGVAITGFFLLFRRERGSIALIAATLILPTGLFLLFYVFGRMAATFWEFRYLSFLLVFLAAGWGSCLDALRRTRSFRAARWLFLSWCIVQGALYITEFVRVQPVHPADRIVAGVESLGLKACFADYCVSELLRVRSGGHLAAAPYNAPARQLPSLQAAFQTDPTAVVIVQGVDVPGAAEAFIRAHLSRKYRPYRRHDFQDGWSVIELKRRGRMAPPTP